MSRCAVAMIVLLCGPAWSGEADQKLNAKTHFRAGTAFYDGAAYDKAIAEYQEAYRLSPMPALLFNLGQAARLKGDRPAAIAFYESYLAAKPAGPVADEARTHLSQLAAEVAESERAPAEGARAAIPSGASKAARASSETVAPANTTQPAAVVVPMTGTAGAASEAYGSRISQEDDYEVPGTKLKGTDRKVLTPDISEDISKKAAIALLKRAHPSCKDAVAGLKFGSSFKPPRIITVICRNGFKAEFSCADGVCGELRD